MTHMTGQLRVLTLNEGENLEVKLFRLEKGWTLHFVLGPSLADKNVRVFVNHPERSKDGSSRYTYRELPWSNYSGSKWDVYDNYCQCNITMGGSFNYYFTTDGSTHNKNGCGNFLVDPTLQVGKYDEKLPLDCITCQTVLAKSLGPFDEWGLRLKVAKESGYNMIHFTPLQELGLSNSSYCIADQMKLNPIFNRKQTNFSFNDVSKLVEYMKQEWEVLSLTDLVLNHTANESPWIQTNPECVYNLVNSPHLKPAYLLDRALWHFTLEVAEGKWESKGVPAAIRTEEHLAAIQSIMWDHLMPKLKFQEFYLMDIDETILQFRSAIQTNQSGINRQGKGLQIVPDPKFRRLKPTIDMPYALHLFDVPKSDASSEEQRIDWCCAALRFRLEQLNAEAYSTIQSHLQAAVNNYLANARWRFVNPDGEKIKAVNAKNPIMYNYFILPKETLTMEQEEQSMYTVAANFCFAHNGWVMSDDPLRNFAEPGSNVYLRRELIPWGDSVKLRYGEKPNDCPFLWKHMREYAVSTARIFHGVRLDNCHSTPIHVAEYLLDEARKVRPDLYVIAELFTSSETKDNIFINRLGINSLIREALSAWDSHEEGRLVHRYGGYPVGAFMQPPARPLVPTTAHAIFFDQTHDNLSPIEKRTVYDVLPSAGLVAMACCATGSNRGYDEFVSHHINVVTEPRVYTHWSEKPKIGSVNQDSGMISAKKALNNLHQAIGQAGFNQVFVDQINSDVVSVTRHNPVSHQSIILIANTAFSDPANRGDNGIKHLSVPGVIDEVLVEAHLEQLTKEEYVRNETFINGLPGYRTILREHFKVTESEMVKVKVDKREEQQVEFVNFPPGSVIAFRVSLNPKIKAAILNIRTCLSSFGYRVHTYSGRNMKDISSTELESIIVKLSLNDVNRVLYRCDAEEKDDGEGYGAYNIPGYGDLVYCGLQGVMSILSKIRANNELGHPLCSNLRDGDWMLDYTSGRLKPYTGTSKLGLWFEKTFANLKQVPRYLVPCYFDAIVTGVFMAVEEMAWIKMSDFIKNGSAFVRRLAAGSLQFCSVVKTASLPTLSPALSGPQPAILVDEKANKRIQACVSLCAGLPHFASGIMRNWGRDTFIALRGLLLLTGRAEEARFIILAYGGTLRHGLIPNLLGEGKSARYNCRDAVWWWLQCVQDYVRKVPNGVLILRDQVSRLYQFDDDEALLEGEVDQPLQEVMQEVLQRHADGVEYRERNAGWNIDRDMSDEGFNNEISVDWTTGFPQGGNEHNCGTWMDKMGSSDTTGNKGKPATPRDGSAVELVGLCMSTVSWLAELHKYGHYEYEGVIATIDGQSTECTFAHWADTIKLNFEKHFYVNAEPVPELEPKPELINKRGIYKDSHGASQPWADFQLRPNFPVAIVVAPQMVNPENAWTALNQAEEQLLGPLGMKTLDPSDWAYNGNYINSDESRGFNYHQGPEWVWPVGYFLRARLATAQRLEASRPGILMETVTRVKTVLSAHNVTIQASDWRSLPELTNKDGAVCHDSCAAQAWSMGCILEVLYDLEQLTAKAK